MNQDELVRALGCLGVDPHDLDRLRRVSFQQAGAELKCLQATAKASYKKLAFALHPDRTGGDEAKTQRFATITAAYKWLQDLRLEPPPVMPRRMVVQYVHYPRTTPSGSTVSTTTASPTYNAQRVVFIKVG